MGFIKTEERRAMEIQLLKRNSFSVSANLPRRKGFQLSDLSSSHLDDGEKFVCVTGGASFLGLAVVNRLLSRRYSVRVIVHSQEEMEKMRELQRSGEMRTYEGQMEAVMAKLSEMESLIEAFDGCRCVFHTAGFTDPAGLSGYTKSMAEVEVKASENVIMACSTTPSIRTCVLTSSLLACIWRNDTTEELSPVINSDSWSDESLCMQKKLWYALGKLRAEKAAWRIAKETGLKLATICPGLITGPDFFNRNPTATIACLKGADEMYRNGILATVDVSHLAEAHVSVFEAMNKTASGRYICFDKVIDSEEDAARLAKQTDFPANKICGETNSYNAAKFQLSNKKLLNLMSRRRLRSCYDLS